MIENLLGLIILNERDNDFFRDTISELLMKIKLTYSDLERHSQLTKEWEKHSNRILDLQEQMNRAKADCDSDLYESLRWFIQITDDNQRAVYHEIKREERKIKEQMIERRGQGLT